MPWIGLPGTVGGAVVGNAGCFGLETSDILKSAEILDIYT
jgi:UDP-N-acetylmuramate dehydrogenase